MAVPIAYNINNLRSRKVTTLLAAGGIALVVVIFVSVLMLSSGFQKTLVSTGSLDNAIILRSGATSELVSIITREQAQIIASQPEVATGPDGQPLASPEAIVIVNIPRRGTTDPSNVVVRGVTPAAAGMRTLNLIEGRMWQPGLSELVAGRLISEKYQGCGIGETVRLGGRDWTVVGVFDGGGTGYDSELWGDNEQINAALRRESFSSVTVRLRDRTSIASLKERIEKDPRFNAQVKLEREFYEEQSRQIGDFIRILGLFISVVFSFAAILAAMLTMYATVGARTAEIGALRAIGFSRTSILASFVVESVLIGLAGGILGILPAFALQTMSFSTTNWTSFSEVAWRLNLSPGIILSGVAFAAAMGFLGGLLPAVRAARLDLIDALREG